MGYSTRLGLIGLIALSSCPVVEAQQSDDIKTIQQNISSLKSDIAALAEKQQQIISQLKDLRRLLQAGSEPPHPPPTMSVDGKPFRGAPAAPIAIIEYADFECSFCGQFMREVYPQIIENYIQKGKVKYVYRDLPMPNHTHAMPAARAARCADEQGKFWEMHESLFANQEALEKRDIANRALALGLDTNRFADCVASEKHADEIRKDALEAQKMGIEGTPTFLLGVAEPNGDVRIEQTLVGSYPYEIFKSNIEDLLDSKRRP